MAKNGFNSDDLLRMASRMENDGCGYYQKAADSLKIPDEIITLLDLGELKSLQQKSLDEFQKQFNNGDADLCFDTSDAQTVDFCKNIAERHSFYGNGAACGSIQKDLLGAVLSEKHSIAFLTGLKFLACDIKVKNQIDGFIKEKVALVDHIKIKIQESERESTV